MNGGFRYSDDNKRYHTYSYYLKHRFGRRVYRAAMDIGAGCPNRCGECGSGGCIFCSDGGTPRGRFTGISEEELKKRFEKSKAAVSAKSPDGLYIPYLQSGSNTFGDTAAFARVYNTLLGYDGVVGLCIATRADCIDGDMADLLAEINEKTYLTVELGLQTAHDETAAKCSRGHTLGQFLECCRILRERRINIGIHIINGLPGESREMMLQTARLVGELAPHSLKIHMLYIEEGTPLARLYVQGGIRPLERGEYVSLVCDQLEMIPPETVITRLTGDGVRGRLIAPEWSLHKRCVLNEIDKEMERRGSYQGIKLLQR